MSTPGLTYDQLMDWIYGLRAHGFRISTEQYVTAYNLLVALAASSDALENPARLRPLLAPVLCTSAEEQQTFDRLFDDWITPRRAPAPDRPDVNDPPSDPPRPRPTRQGAFISAAYRWLSPVVTRKRLLALLALGAAISIGAVAHPATRRRLLDFFFPPTSEDILRGRVTDKNDGRPLPKASVQIYSDRLVNFTTLTSFSALTATTDDAGEFALPIPASRLPAAVTVTYSGYVAAQRRAENAKEYLPVQLEKGGVIAVTPSPLGRYATVAIVILLPAAAAFYAFKSRRPLQFKKGLTRGEPELERLFAERAQEHLTQYLALRRAAQGLRERRPVGAADLNVDLTVEATARRAGLFTPVYSARKLPPEYLVLIDRNTFTDRLAQLGESIVGRLIANGVYIDWFYFQNDPRLCRRDKPDVRYFTLQELAAQYPDHNLIVFSDGAGLFDPVTGYPQDGLELFDPWPMRTRLTPEPYAEDFRDWVWSELGFLVLPADKLGLAALGGLMSTGVWGVPDDDVRVRAKPLPAMLREQSNRWLERHPPPAETIDELCDQLKDFLDPDLFLWLSACAVYPKMNWDVALRLGYELLTNRDRLDEHLLTLARLPWFNQGTMPDWLRKSLISKLMKDEERKIRRQIDLLIGSATSEKAKDLELTFVRALHGGTWRTWERVLTRLRRLIRVREREDDAAQDEVFLSFMSGFKHRDPLAVLIPTEVRSMLMRPNQSVSELYPLNLFMALLLAGFLALHIGMSYGTGNVGFLLLGLTTSGLFAYLLYQVELQTLKWEKATGGAHRLQAMKRYVPFKPDPTRIQTPPSQPGIFHDVETAAGSERLGHSAQSDGRDAGPAVAAKVKIQTSGTEQRLGKVGLFALTAAELWERFSFYSMLALFTLYLQDATNGFGWARNDATRLYAMYLAFVYFSPLIGGLIADLKLGHYKAVIIGGFFFFIGHSLLTFPIVWVMYLALVCLVIGNGFFKPNISVMVGNIYPEGSHFKDRAYNIYYMGVNVGAFIAPLMMEVIKQSAGYHPAFAVASSGMLISLSILWLFKRHVEAVERPPGAGTERVGPANSQSDFGVSEARSVLGLFAVFVIVILFWMAFHQNGATWTYWANDNTDWSASSSVPILIGIFTLGLIDGSDSSGIISNAINPFLAIALTFPLIWFWGWLDRKGKEPSTLAKMGIGMMLVAAAYLIMSLAAVSGGNTGRVSPWWLITAYGVITLGELMLSPMGLSLVSKVAPIRMRGLMMGGWFAATSIGNYLVGTIGVKWTTWTHSKFFFIVAMMCAAVGLLLFLLLRPLKKLMPGLVGGSPEEGGRRKVGAI